MKNKSAYTNTIDYLFLLFNLKFLIMINRNFILSARSIWGGVVIFFLLMPNLIYSQKSDLFVVKEQYSEKDLKKDYQSRVKVLQQEAKSYDFVQVGQIKNALEKNILHFDLKDLQNLKYKVITFEFE